MAEYWLDTNTFIHAKNGPYSFDIAPGFWSLLEQKASEGVIASTTLVYDELVNNFQDELSDWAKAQRASGLFVEPNELVQVTFQQIADYVTQSYEVNQAAEFLSGADPWVIAHAKAHGGRVVTQEVRVGSNSRYSYNTSPWGRII